MGRRRIEQGFALTLRYVHAFTDRHGRQRHYFRRNGKRSPLPGEPGSDAFMAAYRDALADKPAEPVTLTRRIPGSVADLIMLYKAESLEFAKNKPRTRHVTTLILERFAAKHGHRLVSQMKPAHIETIMASMSATPAAANDLMKKLRRLMEFAIKREWIVANPTAGIRPFKEGTHHTWTDEELAQFETCWPLGTKERTAFALHLYTSQRSQDVRQMTWADIRGERIHVVQGKTDAKLWIKLHPDLQVALAAWPKTHAIIIPTAFGKPFTEKGYGQWMAKAIARAGLPDRCVAHGLRKATSRLLAEHGATEKEISGVTGHRTLKEVARYTAEANQARLAATAIDRLPERIGTKSGKP